jgi:hypothetical protein
MGKFSYFCGMKRLKGVIIIYCRCAFCGIYFDVTGVKRALYCGKGCRDKVYYRKRRGLLGKD